MLRDTMMRTIPVAMIAIEALWTERFQRLRGDRNVPPDRMLKPIQMISSATSMPSSRVSTSSERSAFVTGAKAAPMVDRGPLSGLASLGTETPISLLSRSPFYAEVKTRPAPRERKQGASSHVREEHQPQAETFPAATPWQRSAFVTQPASRTSLRLAWVMGVGVRKIELILLPPGVVKTVVFLTLLTSELPHSCTAASPALLPRPRASFQTSTVWVPSAT